MIVTRGAQSNDYYSQVRQKSIQAFEQVTLIHKKFFQDLRKYQCDKDTMIQKIVTLSQAQQTVLLDFCVFCENFSILELGKLMLKMHLQGMQIIKWLINHIGQFCEKIYIQPTVRFERKQNSREKQMKKKGENYFRVKQNSMFLAEGISCEINKIQKQVEEQKKTQLQQLNNILKNKQFVQRIQASQNQKILFQAVDIISHHSEVFRNLTKNNKQAFIDNYKDLNIKPYCKLKAQIDQDMKERVQKANEQLINKLDKYIKSKNMEKMGEKQKKYADKEVQISLTTQGEEKYKSEIKNKNEKIKQLYTDINFQKTKSSKLQNLLRNKINYFQEKLSKVPPQNTKSKQLQVKKKSAVQLTSIHNLHSQTKQLAKIQEVISINEKSEHKVHHTDNAHQGVNKRKEIARKFKQECIYQKSLLRIQFNLQNEFDSQNFSPQQVQHQNSLRKLSICNGQTIFKYEPRDYEQENKRKLQFQSNVIDFNFRQSLKYKERNQSLLTITNMRRKGSFINDGTKIQISKQCNQNQKSHKYIKSAQKSLDLKNIQVYNIISNENLNIKNKSYKKSKQLTIQNEDSSKQKSPIKDQQKIKKLFKQNNYKYVDIESERYKLQNNFQIINFGSEIYLKNKGRVNDMVNSLKRKRKNREFLPKSQKYQTSSQKNGYSPDILLNIYQNQENAMLAELQYGVSIAIFEQNKPANNQIVNKDQGQIEQISNRIYRHLNKERRQNVEDFRQVACMIKTPLSFLKGNINKINQRDLTKKDIINFVRFILVLHQKCSERPCGHFKQFLYQIGML